MNSIKKRKYYLHRSEEFVIPYKGLFVSWEFNDVKQENYPTLVIQNVPILTSNKFDFKEIRENLRNLLPLDKESNQKFNIENIIQNEQVAMMDFFPNITREILDSTFSNLKMIVKFTFKSPPNKIKIVEKYYEMPKTISRPMGEYIDITPEMVGMKK